MIGGIGYRLFARCLLEVKSLCFALGGVILIKQSNRLLLTTERGVCVGRTLDSKPDGASSILDTSAR